MQIMFHLGKFVVFIRDSLNGQLFPSLYMLLIDHTVNELNLCLLPTMRGAVTKLLSQSLKGQMSQQMYTCQKVLLMLLFYQILKNYMFTFLPFSLLEKREVPTLCFWQMIKHLGVDCMAFNSPLYPNKFMHTPPPSTTFFHPPPSPKAEPGTSRKCKQTKIIFQRGPITAIQTYFYFDVNKHA